MKNLEIIIAPDLELKKLCATVDEVDSQIREVMDNMFVTMKSAPGIGLAAPQVGINKRVIVIDTRDVQEGGTSLKMANPKILKFSDNVKVHEEGCLSLPGFFEEVKRPDEIIIKYLDEYNHEQKLEASGLLSVVIQHEIDHLDGVLFVDHISKLKKGIILRKLKKYKKSFKSGKDI